MGNYVAEEGRIVTIGNRRDLYIEKTVVLGSLITVAVFHRTRDYAGYYGKVMRAVSGEPAIGVGSLNE